MIKIMSTKTALVILFTSLSISTACSTSPTLEESAAGDKTIHFLEDVTTDSATAYKSTSSRFQASTSLEEFNTLIDQTHLKDYTSFNTTGVSYQQGAGVNAAKVDGTINFTDLTEQSASFIWSYDAGQNDWTLDAFRFN